MALSALSKPWKTVLVQQEDGITWVILNRPEKRNAMNPTMHYEMVEVLAEVETDPDTSVVVLTGAGESFCAGMDLKEYFRDNENNPAEMARARRAGQEWRWTRLWTYGKPTIAMVNGHCFGGGFVPLIACDIAIAAEDAAFGLSEVNWGTLPGGLVSRVLAEAVGLRQALLFAMTGRPFDGRKAAEIGLVTWAVPRSDLREETIKLAKELAGKSQAALVATKQAYKLVKSMDFVQAADYLEAKQTAMRAVDSEGNWDKGLGKFLDEKSYRPGLGTYRRDG
jgi:trans-feruloyl-CoA hydratase/vanillin synthase